MDLTKPEKALLRKRKLEELRHIMLSATATIVRKINQSINTTETSQKYWNSQLATITKLYQSMMKDWDSWIIPEMSEYYDDAYELSVAILRRAGLEPKGPIPGSGRIIDALINDTVKKFQVASQGGIGEVNTLFREVQTSLIREDEINRAVAEGILTDSTQQRIKSNLEKILTDRLIGKEQIVVAGTKHYKPEDYATMLARTRTRDAQSSAAIQSALQYGVDLVQVSDHNTTTPICMNYEGQIYSISGNTKGYPRLGEIAPFHPNCLHVMLPLPVADEQDEIELQAEAQRIYNRNQQKLQEEI
jgi:ribosomal protein S20